VILDRFLKISPISRIRALASLSTCSSREAAMASRYSSRSTCSTTYGVHPNGSEPGGNS
jgi:hypothetical protein